MNTPQIVDANGRPIASEALSELQTARLTHLQNEFQRHPSRGLTPSRLAAISDQAERGDLTAQAELFEDMEEKDSHIASEMGKRRRALLLDYEVVAPVNPSPEETKLAERVEELVRSIGCVEDMIFDATDAIGKAFACLEVEWQRVGKVWLQKSFTHRPQSWFTIERGYEQQLRLRSFAVGTDGLPGEPLRPLGWVVHTHKAKSGYLERAALFRQLQWPYLFKNYNVGDLAEWLELYGIKIKIGKYPAGAGEKEKSTLLRALAGLGHKAAGIIPDGMLVDFQEGTSGDSDGFELMLNWCERSQSKVILGGTLTSGADGKSSTNALGNVHNEVRKDLRDSDVRQVNATVTRDVVWPIVVANGWGAAGFERCPRFVLKAQELEDLKTFADALPKLVSLGVRPPVQWVHEKLGIPQAEGDEPVLGASPEPPADPGAGVPLQMAVNSARRLLAAAAATVSPTAAAAQAPELMLDQTRRTVAPAIDAWVQQVRALVDRVGTLEELRDGLEQLLPDMTLDQYAEAMSQALAAAALAGRYEILQEAAGQRRG
ncbi:hypothetical protein CLD22_25630 [Rubrivivax gelatinosus]|nr:hypothetical protein [Rubrivivax gelatinosus]